MTGQFPATEWPVTVRQAEALSATSMRWYRPPVARFRETGLTFRTVPSWPALGHATFPAPSLFPADVLAAGFSMAVPAPRPVPNGCDDKN